MSPQPAPARTTRPLRADARRNRERVLDAARAAFEAEGASVPLDEIARRAGVGPGTVHRHFPTKEALLEAVVVGNLEDLAAQARIRLDVPDPWAAFAGFFALMVEEGVGNRVLTGALAQAGGDVHALADRPSRDLLAAVGELLERAQRAGAVRADLTAQHVKALLIGVLAGGEWLGSDATDRGTLVAVVLDGLHRSG